MSNYISYGRSGRIFRVRVAQHPKSANEFSFLISEGYASNFKDALRLAKQYAADYDVADFSEADMRRYFGV